MLLVHATGLEPQTPPNWHQLSLVMLNGLLGTVVSDYLWLWGSILAGALTASLSLSLGVPMSLVADAVLRG
jgi:solute carrier family 35 protein F5